MNSLHMLKNRSNHHINNVFKSTLVKVQTATLLTHPAIKLDSSNIHSDALPQHLKASHHQNPIRAITQRLNIYITVETQWFTQFRQLMMNNFKDYISFIRIEPINHARKMKVCLCFDGKIEDKLMTSIMRSLPSAEFGRITLVQN